jgi:hypothetical protein
MKGIVSTVLLGALVVGLAGTASAFDNKQAGIALHITPANWTSPPSACAVPVTAPTLVYQTPQASPDNFFWTYLLVCNGSDSTGVAGMEMGVAYPANVAIYNWTLCGNLQFPDGLWPASGGSNLITWTLANCNNDRSEPGVPRTVIAIGGYFYMGAYGPSQMSVIPRPVSGRAKVADCSSREDDFTFAVPSHLGVAGFGGAPGYNPCGAPTAVAPSTWSKVKTLVTD